MFAIPVKPINASAKMPKTIKTMPFPASPLGTSEFFDIFSRMPATKTIAKSQPTEEPKENAAVSKNVYSLFTKNKDTAKTTQFTVIKGR